MYCPFEHDLVQYRHSIKHCAVCAVKLRIIHVPCAVEKCCAKKQLLSGLPGVNQRPHLRLSNSLPFHKPIQSIISHHHSWHLLLPHHHIPVHPIPITNLYITRISAQNLFMSDFTTRTSTGITNMNNLP